MKLRDAQPLLGRWVRVTLGEDDDRKLVYAAGKLLRFDEWGEAVLLDEMGGLAWCWPMLDVVEVDAPEGEAP